MAPTEDRSDPAAADLAELLGAVEYGVLVLDHGGCVRYANDYLIDLTSRSRQELYGANIWELFPHLNGTVYQRQVVSALDNREASFFADISPGSNSHFEYHIYPMTAGLLMIVREITEAHASEWGLAEIERARKAEDYSVALSNVTRILFEEPDMSAVLDCVASEGRKALDAESATIDVLDDGELVTRFLAGLPAETRDRRTDPSVVPHVMTAADTRAAVAIVDALDSPMGEGLLDELGVRAVLTVPLYVAGELLGFISFNYHRSAHVWTPAEIDFANKIAATTSLAVESIRAKEELRASVLRFRATFESAAVGIANVGLDGSWLRVNDRMCSILDRARTELIRMTLQEVTLPEDFQRDKAQTTALTCGEIPSYSAEQRFVRPDGSLVWGNLSVSLVRDLEGRPDYFIAVVEDITVRKAVEAELTAAVGYHISLAEENARLYDVEHTIAETLQEALLTVPAEIPGIDFGHRYCSASSVARVGGDFYDLFPLDDGRIGIVVGDVAGKGLDAAVFTSRAKAYLRAESCVPGRTPAQVFRRVNDTLVRESLEESFFTVFLGFLDLERGRLAYSSGGHTTSALVRPDGSVYRLPSTGAILGAFAGLEYRDSETIVSPGDIIFAYTDGLIEARCGEGEMFGEKRLFERLQARSGEEPEQLVNHMIEDVIHFAEHLRDDVAVLAVRRTLS